MDANRISREYRSYRHEGKERRSRSPGARQQPKPSSRNHRDRRPQDSLPATLPFGARRLSKHDFEAFVPIFASYLEIQKNLTLGDLDESEVKGRWKSFMGKWNRGELADGWYDPSRLERATSALYTREQPGKTTEKPPTTDQYEDENDSDDFGPHVPKNTMASRKGSARPGPAIPSMQDIELRKELAEQDAEDARAALRNDRRAHRALEKERLDELVPKAEAGTRERQQEKKKELASSNKIFAAAKEGDGMPEMADRDLLGGDEDDLAGFKRQKMELEKQKSERELKREEVSRAKREEREQRQQEFREREERTMQGFIELARRRYG